MSELARIKVGDRIQDNDPRMTRRKLLVTRLWYPLQGDGAKALCEDAAGREFAILLRRIYLDGKPRKSGFSRIPT